MPEILPVYMELFRFFRIPKKALRWPLNAFFDNVSLVINVIH